MAKTGKAPIDPGFIGVPQFRRSTFDPVQFTQSMMAERRATKAYEGDRAKKERQQNIDFLREEVGEVDVQAWEDTQGYKELSEKKQAIYAKALDYSNRGYNLYSPETPRESAVMREFQNDLENLQGEVDIWNISKSKYREFDKALSGQTLDVPEEERTMDVEKALQWKKDFIAGEGNIQERARAFQRMDFGVQKPLQAAELNEYMGKEIARTIVGKGKTVNDIVDPTTGEIITKTWEGVKPERIRAGLKQIYVKTEGQQREALDAAYEKEVASGYEGDLTDFLVEKYAPQYAETLSKRRKKDAQTAKEKAATQSIEAARPPMDAQGNYDLSEYATTKRYGTQDADGNTVTQNYQSRGTLPVMSIFKNKGFAMPITGGTVVKSTGQKAPEAIAAGTIPIDVSFIPTSSEKFSIEVDNPETGARETVTIEAGERIPEHVQQEMDMQNVLAGDGAYAYTVQPYMEANVYKSMVKDPANPNAPWEVPDPKSEKMTTIRPYNEARIYLRNFAAGLGVDFKDFDNDVLSIQKQLNEERVKENEQFQSLGL